MNKSKGQKQSSKQVLAFPVGLSGHITSSRLIENSTLHPPKRCLHQEIRSKPFQ